MSEYFSNDVVGTEPLRVIPADALPVVQLADGISAAVLMGDRLNINVVTLAPGAVAALHSHTEEQMGTVVSGSCSFSDGTDEWRLAPGDTYHAPSGASHSARAHDEGCVIIDVFSPPRAGLNELLG